MYWMTRLWFGLVLCAHAADLANVMEMIATAKQIQEETIRNIYELFGDRLVKRRQRNSCVLDAVWAVKRHLECCEHCPKSGSVGVICDF